MKINHNNNNFNKIQYLARNKPRNKVSFVYSENFSNFNHSEVNVTMCLYGDCRSLLNFVIHYLTSFFFFICGLVALKSICWL